VPAGRAPPALSPSDIAFRRIGGEPCLEVTTATQAALRLEIERDGRYEPLEPLLPPGESRRFRVDPSAIARPVRLRAISAERSVVTTDFLWHGLTGQLAGMAPLLERARTLTATERLLELPFEQRRRAVGRLRESWSRWAQPLFEIAPVVLDHPVVPLERKRAVYDALAQLRVLDRLGRMLLMDRLVPPDVLGRTCATGLADGAAVSRPPSYLASTRVRVATDAAPGTRNVVRHVIAMAEPGAEGVAELAIEPPRDPRADRVVLELDSGSLVARDLLWVEIGGWTLLFTEESHARRTAYPGQDERVYHALDPRLLTNPAGLRIRARHVVLPGDAGHSELRTLDRIALYYLSPE
jgi:hypothetical protein